ncbi:hypothetical protein [Paenibacillus cineris]|uniref:Uncharacterized protein n=1 Tax=Paenibacillus cineris TaxID=237530 RepID=A0ABQ4LK55_9BACL|nr:hypothetical protein [Paenibacillus cineris]GIO56903.1 hypothetical protein J21TS7_52210 [Paenibacillus cineris]
MNDNIIQVLVKAWESFQNLSKGFGENAWKVRTMGIGFWAAIIAYGYKNKNGSMYLIALMIILIFLLLEAGMRILQNKYIEKSIEMERSINDYLVGAEIQIPKDGISTNVLTPTVVDLLKLFQPKRWMFWLPYLLLVLASIFMDKIL